MNQVTIQHALWQIPKNYQLWSLLSWLEKILFNLLRSRLAISPFFANSLAGLSGEESRDVELVQYLLSAAEKVGQQQFGRANKLICQLEELSSAAGNPVQRLVFYFSEALRQRVNLETGRITSNSLGKKQIFDCDEAMIRFAPSIIAFHVKLPFSQVCQFVGVQAIIENVAEARKIHIIDLEIRNGIQCMVLMQALALRYESG